MTRAVRVALGALAAAIAAQALAPDARLAWAAALIAMGVALLAAGRRRAMPRRSAPGPAGPSRGMHAAIPVASLVGAALVLGRVAIGAGGAPGDAAALPDRVDGPGRVVSVSAPKDGRQRFVVEQDDPARLLDARGPRFPEVSAGSRVVVVGRVRAPGDDAYGRSLAARGISGTIDVRSLALAPAEGGPGAALAWLRTEADRALRASVPEPAGGLAAGVLLGLRERVPRDVTADFVATGLSHVVAISGWNIAIVAAALAVALRRMGRRRRTAATLGAICLYVALVGASPPVIRAALMAATVMVAREAGRPTAAATALACAVLAMLVADPAAVGDPGFRLSSAATAGLIVWGTQVTDRLRTVRGRSVHPWLAETLGVSLAAQAATLPLVLAGFGRLSLVSPAVNLVVAPIVAPAMAAGAVALAGGAATLAGVPGLASLAGIPAWVTFGAITGIASAGARVPFASVTIVPPWDTVCAALAAAGLAAFGTARGRRAVRGVAALLRPRRRDEAAGGAGLRRGPSSDQPARGAAPTDRVGGGTHTTRPTGGSTPSRVTIGKRARTAALVVAVVAAGLAIGVTRAADGRPRIDILDIGQGDSILISGEHGGRVLVDGGPDPDRLVAALDARVPPWDRRIDLVVVTHPHEDHAAGLAGLLGRYRIGRVVGSGLTGAGPGWAAWADGVAAHGIPSGTVAAGDRLAVDGVRMTVLWPDPGTVSGRAGDDGRVVNDTSVVLLGEAAGVRFLLPGDAEDAVDPTLVARGLPHVALLKVAHHGSRTATSDALLAALSPQVAAISVGAGNTYGHPSPATLARIAARHVSVLRTDRDGTVTAWFAMGRMEVRGERRAGTGGLGYHRRDDGPRARRVGGPPPLPRPAAVVPAARVRRRRDRGLARGANRRGRTAGGCRPRRGGRAPPRRGQVAPRRCVRRRARARSRVGRLARAARAPGARAGDRGARRDAARRAGRDRPAARRARRGPDRRLRGQARGAATGVDGGALRILGPPVPGRDGRCGRRGGPRADARGSGGARGVRLRARGDPARGRAQAPMDSRSARGGGQAGPRCRVPERVVNGDGGAPVVLVTGDDALGVEREARKFAAQGADPSLLRTVRVLGISRPAALAEERAAMALEAVATGSLFGDGAFVVVVDAPSLLGTDASKQVLLEAVGLVADGNVLALLALADESGRPRAGVAELRAAVEAAGGTVRSVSLPADLARWIGDTAPEMGVRLGRGAASELARRLGGQERTRDVDRRGMAAEAVAELTKLGLYREDGEVSVDDVRALVAERLPASVFDMLDAIGARRPQQAIRLMERATATVPGPVLVVRIHRRLRELAIVGDMTTSGVRQAEIAKALEWKGTSSTLDWRVDKHRQQAAAWSPGELVAALDGLLDVDAAMKGEGQVSERAQRLALVLWIVERVAAR